MDIQTELAKFEAGYNNAVQIMLIIIDKIGIEATRLALEDAIEVKNQEK